MDHFFVFHVSVVAGATMAVSAVRGIHAGVSCLGVCLCLVVAYAHRPQWLRRSEITSDNGTEDTSVEFPDES